MTQTAQHAPRRRLPQLSPQAPRHIAAWYAIAESRELRNKPLGVERLGRKLVLWRDAQGNAVVQEARCPHRGADLALGRVVEGELQCPYHGFRFRADGSCSAVPCEGPSYTPSEHMRTRSYAVRERCGLIWMWLGTPARNEPEGEPPWFDEVPTTLARSCTQQMLWQVPYERVMQGMLDMHHTPFAHRSVMWGLGERLDPFETYIEQDGRTIVASGVMRKEEQPPEKGVSFELRLRFPGLMLGKLLGMSLLVAITPIDAERTWIVYRYYSDKPIIGKLLAWLAVVSEDRLVQVDDQRLQESSTPAEFDRQLNQYVPADAAFLLWHKLYRRQLREQARQLNEQRQQSKQPNQQNAQPSHQNDEPKQHKSSSRRLARAG